MPFAPKPSPSPQKPAVSSIFERLGITRPAPKLEPKPQAAPQSKGLFGGKTYKSFLELRQFARKAPYAPIPGTFRKLGQKQRVGMIQELQTRAKKMGQTYGLSSEKLNAVLGKMKKEKMYAKTFKEKKALEDKIKVFEQWKKGF